MKAFGLVCAVLLSSGGLWSAGLQPFSAVFLQASAPLPPPLLWPAGLPVYDHIVVVIEENKDYGQIVNNPAAPYINGTLKAQGASLTKMFAEEHYSEGNYLWLFSGSNQNAGFTDRVPSRCFNKSNLGGALIAAGLSFKGYSEGLPMIGFAGDRNKYARKHVPWINFCDLPKGRTVADSTNLRFQDFPTDYNLLPTVSFVIPNLVNDMHNGAIPSSIAVGDNWLKENLDGYYNWAKEHNSLLIVTFDESGKAPLLGGLTDPSNPNPEKKNQIATIFAGAHINKGEYPEGKGVTHVNILRTLEAMYRLNKSGSQQPFALNFGISDDFILTDIFESGPQGRGLRNPH